MSRFELPAVLEETAAALLAKHLDRAKEWFPHELVPWGQAQDFSPDDAAEVPVTLAPGVASALWVNLLTEDNLPYYFHAIADAFGFDSAMGEWGRRWTAEEQRHACVIRDWVCATRAVDPVALERARMAHVSAGYRPEQRNQTLSDGLVYLALQELATRISHWNTGDRLGPDGRTVMRRVAADENLHHLFYRDMVSAALDVDPSEVVLAIDQQVSSFEMPGATIDGFATHAAAIAAAGIYDYRVHYQQILAPVVIGHWQLETVEGLTPAADAARNHCLARMGRLERIAARLECQSVGPAHS